ncbi:DUF1244 domain-containing protein [Salinisphaera aquimarina]|uniref:DUF1244 domain-containing protein n=1 Tax=Salinisphaera aquimarina TaxID=2094031 RepID=A0ABV7ETK1_9GAMM
MNEQTRIEAEAAAFRGLLKHLQQRTDVQNIDLMNLAGFCRNCLAKWYRAEAEYRGATIDYDEAREHVYGMPYDEWKDRYQPKANADQKQRFESTRTDHADTSAGN